VTQYIFNFDLMDVLKQRRICPKYRPS